MKILKDILKDIDILDTTGSLSVPISGIEYDSRNVKKGSIFVAIGGFDKDGVEFIDSAIKNGASAIVLEKNTNTVSVECDRPLIFVVDSRKALAVLATNFFGNPSSVISVVGITGTNGKTTTAMIVDSILRVAYKKSSILSTISYRIGNTSNLAIRTTPESPELQEMFKEMVDSNINHCVMEVSSHSLELSRVHKINFAVGVFTNLTQDHLDFHKSEDEYFKSKLKLFTDYNLKKAIVNIDDPRGNLVCKATNAKVTTIGIVKKADIMPEDLELSSSGVRFIVKTQAEEIQINSKLIGVHNVYNILCSIGTALALNVSLVNIAKGISVLERVPGRFEKIDEGQEFTVVVDYAHTDDALKNVVKAGREFTEKKVILVFGCGGGRDTGKRQKMGAIAGKYADYSIITSDNPRNEDPALIIDEIEKGIQKTTEESKYCLIIDRKEAIKKAINIAEKGDIVILAGKGHETYQTVGNKNISFDDCEVARNTLKQI